MWAAALLLFSPALGAQQFPTDDPVIRAIWEEGMENSQAYALSQVLADSIGPRLPGSPGYDAGANWVIKKFQEWGYEGWKDEYGTWPSWERGITHVDLLEPRVRSLDAMMLAWSPGTNGPVTAEVVAIPATFTPEEASEILSSVEGKFVLFGPAELSCRPADNWEEFAAPGSFERLQEERRTLQQAFRASQRAAAEAVRFGPEAFEEAGALGVINSSWPGGWGVRRIFSASTETIPTISMSCEDYGLLYRLAENDQNPVIRVGAEASFGDMAPAFNVLGAVTGTEKPEEYIILSAHFDTWDGGSGATDNNTGSINMMETLRILSETYPNPKRSIIVGLWNSEEQGLNGSRAFVADHPEIVENIHAVFNQDNGTGRVVNISMQGFTGAGAYFGEWLSSIPGDITRHIDLTIPGTPGGGGSDYASFVCAGVPAFSLSSLGWAYSPYTWHTNLDTFDKLVMDDVMNNATLTAMLVYLASEEEQMLPRDRRILGLNPRTGEPRAWPQCRQPNRGGLEP
ncbi:MAG: M20/M25/M40 family metallo-hydrolase [Gemmatimonadetes bacterium]|nr:M20/M25/M40 family metallo-hydrolase [Gemmatimonadota bacterium]